LQNYRFAEMKNVSALLLIFRLIFLLGYFDSVLCPLVNDQKMEQ